MKTFLAVPVLLLFMQSIQAQFGVGTFTFETEETYIGKLYIDTLNHPNNIWHIGTPQKEEFNSAYSEPNCIYTDTAEFYSTDDTSSFVIEHLADQGFTYPHTAFLYGYYKIDSDTLNDFGLIEFSPNNGDTWYNLLELGKYDGWMTDIPVFSGRTEEWTEFGIMLSQTNLIAGIEWGDTVLYKFTFISDSIQNNREGWMLDNITIEDWAEGVESYKGNSFSSNAYPNPANESIEIEYGNSDLTDFRLIIIDSSGRLVFKTTNNDGKFQLNKSDFGGSGIYIYHIFSEDFRLHSTGKFLVQ